VEVQAKIQDFIIVFVSILYEAIPFIVLGAIISGILEELVPQRIIARLIPKNRFLGIAMGGFLGLIFPMCECGIIPIMRRLLRKGVPLSTCTCYLLAGPIVNFVVILSTMAAFKGMEQSSASAGSTLRQLGGTEMVLVRCGMGYLVAFFASVVVEWQFRKHGYVKLLAPYAIPPANAGVETDEEAALIRDPWTVRVRRICDAALHDFIDIMVYLILGAVIAATVRQVLTHQQIEDWSVKAPVLAILVMMALALLISLCSEADAFIAASFVALRPSAKAAFLVLGPMMDLKLFLMYTRIFRPRLIWTIITSVIIQVFVYSVILHFLLETYGPHLEFAPKSMP
jgi:uncharacterized membrane protein YraQ (UPF0718 family)